MAHCRLTARWVAQLLAMFGARIDPDTPALPIDECAVGDHWISTVLGLANAVLYEPEALAGLDGEGGGVVALGSIVPLYE